MQKILLKWVICLLPVVANAQTTTNCFDIQSILVDACGSNEGNNEMVRFLVGPNNLNTSNMNAVWANTSNSWLGICQNATTAGYVSQLNNTIVSCGYLLEPVNGILPANKKVILVSGINFDPSVVSFAGLSDTLYMIFHCGSATSGNFANVGTGIRNFSMSFTSPGGNCNDAVSYDRSLLPGGNGATVEYTINNTASYTNYGCNVPAIPLSAAWTQPQPLCQGDAPINLNSLVTGTPGGTWSGQGVTGNSFSPAGLTGNIAVNYTVGNANCSVEEEKFVTISLGGNAAWTPPSPICAGTNIANLNSLVTGTAGGTWSGQGVTGSSFSSTGLLGNIAVTYSVGSGTCVSVITQNINVISGADASWSISNQPICSNAAPIQLNPLVTGTLGGTWSGSGVNGNTFSPSGLSGNITITYTVGSGTCSDTEVQTVNVVTASNASWTPPQSPLCANEIINNLNSLVTGTSGGTWSGQGVSGATFSSAGLIGNIPLTYSVGSGACASVNTQNINVILGADASWNISNQPICSNATPIQLNLLVTGTPGGVWTGQGVSGSVFSPLGLSGNITINYTVGSGTCSDSEDRIVSIVSSSDASWLAQSAICENGNSINLNTLISGTTGGTWSGQGVTGSSFSPNGLSGNVSITYTVGENTCIATNTQDILINAAPLAPVLQGAGTYCFGVNPLNITATGENAATINWYTDANLTQLFATGLSASPTLNLTQTYYSVQSLNGCTSESASVTIDFTPLPITPEIPATTNYCAGSLPLLSASGSSGTYNWYSDAALSNFLASGSTYQVIDPLINVYYVVAENNNCISTVASTSLVLGNVVEANIVFNGDLVLCKNENLELTSSSISGNVWSTSSTSNTITVTEAGLYTLTVNGFCNSDVDSVIIINGSVTADFTAAPLNGPAPLNTTITDQSINADQIFWTINDSSVTINSGESKVFEAGVYVVNQLVISLQGCRDSISQTIKATSDLVEFLVPNSFTPNGDTKNDTFKAVTYGIEELSGTIFNRWGEQIFQWKGTNNGWDGRTNGKASPDGVYFYLITAKDALKKNYEKYGSVTLLR